MFFVVFYCDLLSSTRLQDPTGNFGSNSLNSGCWTFSEVSVAISRGFLFSEVFLLRFTFKNEVSSGFPYFIVSVVAKTIFLLLLFKVSAFTLFLFFNSLLFLLFCFYLTVSVPNWKLPSSCIKPLPCKVRYSLILLPPAKQLQVCQQIAASCQMETSQNGSVTSFKNIFPSYF